MRTLFLTLLLSFCWTLTHAQARVSGTISDSLSGVPIIGAYIFLKSDFSIGAASDISGNYKFDLPE
jgi:hypothetical protein